ncbi:MAG: restriction endonuclease subunit S, partial [Alkalispirochaetaceae bacterium]
MIDFVLNHFDELAALPGAVPKLRSFILDQAVRGNLTADWRREHPDVEPVSALLERIREEKKELVKAGKIKKQKELPPVDSDEVPFEIPGSWEWVRLG